MIDDSVFCHSTILDSPVTEQEFLEQLHELNSKINFAKELSFRETLACSDIQDIVDRLKIKVRRRDVHKKVCGVYFIILQKKDDRFKSGKMIIQAKKNPEKDVNRGGSWSLESQMREDFEKS